MRATWISHYTLNDGGFLMNATKYQKNVQAKFKELNPIPKGLTEDEVKEKQKQDGYNELQEGKKKSIGRVFLEQFNDFLVIILILAAIISTLLGEMTSSIVIIVVITLNAILGTVQYMKAEKSLNSLKAMAAPLAKVIRDGAVVVIPAREVVVGDILQLEAGDYVSADGLLLDSHGLQINESHLTGESDAVDKLTEALIEEGAPIGDRKNMVFSGSFVAKGRGQAVVTSIGMKTELGKIAELLDSAKEKTTPLQISLDNFGKRLAIGIIVICFIVFILDIFRGRELGDSFMFAVSLAVAAIPEALSSIVTIVLAFGTQKMAEENAIVRELHAVESLGSISVICSDKTGTLTQNKMTVQQVYINEEILSEDKLQLSNGLQKTFMNMALLCNDSIKQGDKEIGSPTEIALVKWGEAYRVNELSIREQFPRVAEIPFDSTRKLMSTVNKIGNRYIMITKGAVDVLLSKVARMETSIGVFSVTQNQLEAIKNANSKLSSEGLRVLAFAYKEVNSPDIKLEDERDLTFMGLVAMMDPPREETKQAVIDCIKAGIKPVMITGDHKITAMSIARQIGILKDSSEAIEGKDIEHLSDKELQELVGRISVYARVSPEHKIRIVKAWQEKGNIVAMTGDGVNDAPALKQADVGVAMGITGTEVAKDASSIVLTDDNFSTIVRAISNGRSIYYNIKNSIMFLLSGNTAAIIVVLFATLFALPAPFAPVHLLFINLLTDSLPAIAIGLEPHNKKLMKDRPRNIQEPLLNKKFAQRVGWEGLVIAVMTIIAFQIGLSTGDAMVASTMAFATLCLSRLFHGFSCRARESILEVGLFTNIAVWAAFLIGVILLNTVLALGLLEVADISTSQLVVIYGLAFLSFIIIQLEKALFKKGN